MEKFFHENQNKPKYIASFVFLGMIKPYLVNQKNRRLYLYKNVRNLTNDVWSISCNRREGKNEDRQFNIFFY